MTAKRLIVALVAAGVIVAIASKASTRRQSEWHGLTESEARSKLDAKLPKKIPDDKRAVISDKVVAKMRDKGVLRDDESAEGAPADATDTADASNTADAG